MLTLHMTDGWKEVYVAPDALTLIQSHKAGGSQLIVGTDWRIRVTESPTEIRALIADYKAAQQEVLHVAS